MKLGDTQIKRVGLGTNRLENTGENRAFVKEAVAAGLDHIDTAHLYRNGDSERTIGAALNRTGGDVVVATKGGYHGAGRIRAEIDQSLQSLARDEIGLYYLHRPDPKEPIEEAAGLLAELQREGKIRNIGISNVSIGEIDRAGKEADIAAVQNEFNLGERKHDEVVDYCAVEGIAFVPYFPLRGGGKAVEEIASDHGATPNQVKIAWLLRRSEAMAPIPGTLSIEHLRENLEATGLELTDEEFEKLSGS